VSRQGCMFRVRPGMRCGDMICAAAVKAGVSACQKHLEQMLPLARESPAAVAARREISGRLLEQLEGTGTLTGYDDPEEDGY